MGSDGQPLQCFICKSIFHLKSECPHLPIKSKENETLVAASAKVFECEVTNVFVGEYLNFMILDTGCPFNVSGKVWFNCFLDSFSPEERGLIKHMTVTISLNLEGELF